MPRREGLSNAAMHPEPRACVRAFRIPRQLLGATVNIVALLSGRARNVPMRQTAKSATFTSKALWLRSCHRFCGRSLVSSRAPNWRPAFVTDRFPALHFFLRKGCVARRQERICHLGDEGTPTKVAVLKYKRRNNSR